MQYFTQEYINFFLELEMNNRKEWFHDQKKRYENHVRKPMIAFTSDLIDQLKMYDPDLEKDPKKCLGRINRDIRFSKDKTPYNRHLFAHVSKGSKTEPGPGIAYRFGGADCGIMSGYYSPTRERLQRIRKNIAAKSDVFQNLVSNETFKSLFGELRGEKNKRIPKEFADVLSNEPLIANKQFYFVTEKPADFIVSETLLEDMVNHWLVARPLNEFLSQD